MTQAKSTHINDQNLHNITKDVCREVYPHILKNSEDNWNAGKLLARHHLYGQALSLVLISIEELIKGTIVEMDGVGFELRSSRGFKRFFKEHGIRYYIAFILLGIYVFAEDLVKELEKMIKDPNYLKKIESLIEDKDLILSKADDYMLEKAMIMEMELPFFTSLEKHRQRGFYCDYESGLRSPDHVDETFYNECIAKLTKVRSIGKGIGLMFNVEKTPWQ